MSIFCNKNTLGAVEQERSRRETQGIVEFSLTSQVLYSSQSAYITVDTHKRTFYVPFIK